MADFFSFLSDTDDSAVDDLLSQVQDLCVLEQVSAINCSGLTDSELPSDLESRFRKLKSFPLANPRSSTFLSSSDSRSTDELNQNDVARKGFESLSDEDARVFSSCNPNSEGKRGSNRESGFRRVSSLVDSPNFSTQKGNVTPVKDNSEQKKRSKSVKVLSPSLSPTSSRGSDGSLAAAKSKLHDKKSLFSPPSNSSSSPLKKLGGFWRSLKKSLQKKNKENKETLTGHGRDKKYYDEFLSDLEHFSTKKQQKILKKALREEQKISRETEKIVKWAKQNSARMSFSAMEDDLSDTEITK